MNQHKNYDIVIVGAGLVGATLGCAIAQLPNAKHLRIAIIEAHLSTDSFAGEHYDPRVVSLTHASKNLLQEISVWEKIQRARACAYNQMHVWDGEGTAHIDFSAADVRASELGHIVENSVITHALHERLNGFENITLIHPAKVEQIESPELNKPDTLTLVMDSNERIHTKLLLAADGAQSKIRELANFETREWDYGQTAIVATVHTQLPHQETAWQRFMHTGPLAFLPLNDVNEKHFCSIVWSADHEFSKSLMALSNAEFCKKLAESFEHKLGEVIQVSERFAIPLRQRHAKNYIQPQIALVGDAAHNIHPLAGQGVNLGLLDVRVIVQEINRALERKIPLDDYSILRRYQRARLASNLIMMSAMEGFKRLFGTESLWITWLRNLGVRQLNSLKGIKKILIRSAMGMD